MKLKAYFSLNYLRFFFSIKKLIASLLSVFGGLWGIVEMTSFFSQSISNYIKTQRFWFFIIGVLVTLWITRPKLSASQRLNGRDVVIDICVGDLFAYEGTRIIGSNTTFDTEINSGLISERSIQGQFTTKYYDNINHLDTDLEEALKHEQFTITRRQGNGKDKVYELGTVAKLRVRGNTEYFIAIANINIHGTADSTFEDLKDCFVKLWDYIATRGGLEPLIIPVLGSGFSRIEVKREEIIQEMIKSFIAACSTKKFSERLTIVIHPKDYSQCNIDFNELSEFLKYQCKYTQFKENRDVGGGIGLNTVA